MVPIEFYRKRAELAKANGQWDYGEDVSTLVSYITLLHRGIQEAQKNLDLLKLSAASERGDDERRFVAVGAELVMRAMYARIGEG